MWSPVCLDIIGIKNLKKIAYDAKNPTLPPIKKSAFSCRGRFEKLAIEPK